MGPPVRLHGIAFQLPASSAPEKIFSPSLYGIIPEEPRPECVKSPHPLRKAAVESMLERFRFSAASNFPLVKRITG